MSLIQSSLSWRLTPAFVLCWQARTSTCSFGNDVREAPGPHVIFCIHIFQLIFDKATISTVARLFIQMFSKAGWKMSASPNALVCGYYHKMMAILDLKHNSFLDWNKENRELLLHERLCVPTAGRRHQIFHPTRH